MTLFRPCIDLHEGKVKQIVGGSLTEKGAKTNFVSEKSSSEFAELYREHDLKGGHIIALGPGNESAALEALKAWPQGMQFGGGVNLGNAERYLNAGASQVIVTSWLFNEGEFDWRRLEQIVKSIGKEKLILDLSCRKKDDSWYIATNRWQTVTNTEVNKKTLDELSNYCCEFLIHAADVEGLQGGVDDDLVRLLGANCTIPLTYAGGARGIADLELVNRESKGRVDLTIGSALDIFGGEGASLVDCIAWNKKIE